MDNYFKIFSFRAVLDCMVLPLQDKLEDWKKSATSMDKDHAKEYKKLRSEIKKRSEAVSRAQKKQKKSKSGSNDQHIATKVKQIYLIRSTTYSYARWMLNTDRSNKNGTLTNNSYWNSGTLNEAEIY